MEDINYSHIEIKNAPKWARWAAMNDNKEWYFYEHMPLTAPMRAGQKWEPSPGKFEKFTPDFTFTGYWIDSLCMVNVKNKKTTSVDYLLTDEIGH